MLQDPAAFTSILSDIVRHPVTSMQFLHRYGILRWSQFNEEKLVTVLHNITGANERRVKAAYREAIEDVCPRYDDQFDNYLSRYSVANVSREVVGTEKFVRFDRIALYCLARILEPSIFIETGVKWGESSFFITEALRRNEVGMLYSYDIGLEHSSHSYPENVDRVGFLLPEENKPYWELTIGDSIEKMAEHLPDIEPVDIFYHDSLHTYKHMFDEFKTVLPYMRAGGLLMSEDIDENAAWEDFQREYQKRFESRHRYYSMHSIDNSNREIGVAVLD